ncbi:thioredoxin reductase (NADPH) [Melaminivora alkalimesophila]|uniref:Ferredoxin--NADP reductase n=1 Tax=Melaminivora alkalimesophila TaxID=1165852 RepID=A0A317R9V6_9BURK|nr:NAD(P)/FAD-dependent oxidoreductase [Melaminivora alkalimesophila]PWW45851.1 thioredoxin reductase (NADPH) [Melaminivora alkalimesophila]
MTGGSTPTGAAHAPQAVAVDAVVIGAGPVGLFQVFQLGLHGLQAHVIDALPYIGGQCAELYGDKPIYDIPGIRVCTGNELVQRLHAQITPFAPTFHLGQQADMLQVLPEGGFLIGTARGTQLKARTVFIASGVGAFMPRTLKLPGLQAHEGRQVLYHWDGATRLAGQQVVVHGGGAPAVELAIALATAPEALRPARVTLQHRRDVFDATPAVLDELQALRAAGRIAVAIGMASATVEDAGRLTGLELTTPEGATLRLPLDALLVRLGLVPRLGPIADWGLQLERKQLVVDTATFSTNVPGIHAVGDAVTYPGKRKLILSGFHEAALAAFGAAEWLAGRKLPLEYTTSSERLHGLLGVGSAAQA